MDKSSEEFKLIQQRLRKAITESGMTLKEISEKSGNTLQSLYRIMNRDFLPRLRNFVILCYALQVSPDYILGLTDNKTGKKNDK